MATLVARQSLCQQHSLIEILASLPASNGGQRSSNHGDFSFSCSFTKAGLLQTSQTVSIKTQTRWTSNNNIRLTHKKDQ
jgi:hypothetical protein